MFSERGQLAVASSLLVILLIGLSSFGSAAYNSTGGSPTLPIARLIQAKGANSFESLNWAGYAINATAGSVTQVKGSWVQSSVTCPSSGILYVAFWTGIDGLTSSTVEQTGTMAQCSNGVASYSAWYEFYPSGSVTISSLNIQPGNKISATVKYSTKTSKFTVSIKDVTTGKSYSISSAVSGALRSSAEWITETPEVCSVLSCSLSSLPNFATASFGKDSTSVSSTDSATISGANSAISKFGSMVDELTMVTDPTGTPVMAQPSSLSTDGTSFSVTWVSPGP